MAPGLQPQSANEGDMEYRGYACGRGTGHRGSEVQKNKRSAEQRNSGQEGNDPTLDGRLRRCGKLDEQPTPNERDSGRANLIDRWGVHDTPPIAPRRDVAERRRLVVLIERDWDISKDSSSGEPLNRGLLARPLVAPALLPHPGCGMGISNRIENVPIRKWCGRPGRTEELKQAEVGAIRIHRAGIEVRLAAANPQQIFLRLGEGASRLPDDGDDLLLRRWLMTVRRRFADLLDQTVRNPPRGLSMTHG